MLRIILAIVLTLGLTISVAQADEVCTRTSDLTYPGQGAGKHVRAVTYTCTADSADAAFPSTTIKGLTGWYLYRVWVAPGTTKPTVNSDITLSGELNTGTDDFLGGNGTDAVDNGTTLNRIIPRNDFHSLNEYPLIVGDLTMAITNNSVNSAEVSVMIIGVK